MANDPVGSTKTGLEILGEVIKLAGNDANVKKAGGELGKTALTITRTVNNALLPLAAVNFAFEKARKYFAERFDQDLQEKAANIPSEALIEPKASVAGPALQGLAFAHEEEGLKNLFLELLAGAMDKRKADLVHPAFVEIVKQLEAEEARHLQAILKTEILPIGTLIKRHKINGSHINLLRHVLQMTTNGKPTIVEGLGAMVDNWSRLGLVTVSYTDTLTDERRYEWLSTRPELTAQPPELEESEFRIEWMRGIIYPTELGNRFGRAVGASV
ncbi:DUF4393 domain-containing protein [Xanthomonas arboricola]|uniref:DUF4393 domain-containing protein n=1 Tax=Xanthomonas arboricola TaxID=56448 RepID=UPI000F8F25F8|nr:DUF4393 domain-containing protein [Xanthomonas arboricola]